MYRRCKYDNRLKNLVLLIACNHVQGGHVGGQNNKKCFRRICMIKKFLVPSRGERFVALFLSPSMAAVTSFASHYLITFIQILLN